MVVPISLPFNKIDPLVTLPCLPQNRLAPNLKTSCLQIQPVRTIRDEGSRKVSSLEPNEIARRNIFQQLVSSPSADDDAPVARSKMYFVVVYPRCENIRHAERSRRKGEKIPVAKELAYLI